MKKIIALAMVLVMSLSLVACGIGEKDLVGTWRNTTSNNHSFTLVLEENNDGTLSYDEQKESFTWEIEDETLILDQNNQKVKLSISENEEKIELHYGNDYYVLVAEEEYNTLFETIEITKDNWQEYFEFKDGVTTHENEFEEISSIFFGTEFNLKEEYAEKCKAADLAIEYEFKDNVIVSVEYNVETEEISVSDPLTEAEIEDKGYYYNPDETASGMTSFDSYNLNGEFAPHGYRGAQNETWEMTDNVIKFDVQAYQTPEIVRIEGSIAVRK